jgi:UDP-N-acetylmuramate--alanine ligase
MSGLARLAAEAGYRVSGSDRDESPVLATLRAEGVDARAGHAAEALPEALDAVVVSTAIPADNPEVVAARGRGVPVLHRVDLLAELMRGRRGLAVVGAHGKSTTCGMLAMALGSPSICVGAALPGGRGIGARWGDPPWFVAEADESDRSLLKLAPEAAILLNVDHDHHATYASIDEVEAVFREFVSRLPREGMLVVGPDERALACADAASCEVRALGVGGRPWGRLEGERLVPTEGAAVELALSVPGRHNLENAAAAVALADWCGVPPGEAAERIAGFTGVGRRFEHRGSARGVAVVDDYAHHPAEITATLTAARERRPDRVVVVFQPHLYSRTRALLPMLATALGAADLVVVTEIYAAREAVDPSLSGRDLAAAVPGGDARFVARLDDVTDMLTPLLRDGDLVITMGAGDVTVLGGRLLARLEEDSDDGRGADEPRG